MVNPRWIGFFALILLSAVTVVRPGTAAEEIQSDTSLPEKSFAVRIVNPAPGSYAFGRVPIIFEADLQPGVRLAKVSFFVDGKPAGTVTQAPWELIYDFGDERKARTIKIIAEDSLGRTAESEIATSPPTESDFRVGTVSVSLDVTVTDERGKFVAGLEKDDFKVFEDGRLMEILHFSAREKPLLVAIVLDTSGSMRGNKMDRAVEASQRFVGHLKPEDKAEVIVCGPVVRTYNEFTDDFEYLITRIGRIKARTGAGTPLKLAIQRCIESFEGLDGRKAMIVISDGADNSLRLTPSELYDKARRADVKIYAIGFQDARYDRDKWLQNSKAAKLLMEVTSLSGGRAHFPESANELPTIFDSVFDELRSQYSIGYAPPPAKNDRWRSLDVKIEKAGLVVRTRKGYYPRDTLRAAYNHK